MKGVDRLAASVARKIVFACAKAEIFFLFFPKLYTRIEKYHGYCWEPISGFAIKNWQTPYNFNSIWVLTITFLAGRLCLPCVSTYGHRRNFFLRFLLCRYELCALHISIIISLIVLALFICCYRHLCTF